MFAGSYTIGKELSGPRSESRLNAEIVDFTVFDEPNKLAQKEGFEPS